VKTVNRMLRMERLLLDTLYGDDARMEK